jgi:integrase
MASLSKIKKKTGTYWRIDFLLGDDPTRKQIRIGKMSEQQATTVKSRIEYLIAAKTNGVAPDPETNRWVSSIGDDLHAKLNKHNLVGARTKVEIKTLGEFVVDYISRRSDTKPSTRTLFGNVRRNLLAFFKADRSLDSISASEADDWRRWLAKPVNGDEPGAGGQGLALETVRQRCRIAKQFFRDAVRRNLIAESPFGDMKGVSAKGNRDKDYFVTHREAKAVLSACPDSQWQLIFALSRYGGLRCPSEHLAMRWGDIDWERDRMLVRSCKTEHHEGKATRTIPIFPELRTYLDAVWDEAEEKMEFVITRWRDAESNLRTRLHSIIRAAGLEPWPKAFVALRSTRRTELEELFPSHVVNAWLGHGQRVAERHYLQVTDEHFAKATGEAQHMAQQQAPQHTGTEQQVVEQECENPDDLNNRRDFVDEKVGVTELESVTSCMSSGPSRRERIQHFPAKT